MRTVSRFCLLAAILVGCEPQYSDKQKDTIPFRNISTEIEYVGDAACFDCHENEWRGFQSHGMSHSFYPMSADREVEDFSAKPVYHEASNFYYRAFKKNGGYFQEEYRVDDVGKKTHSLVRKIDYVLGSGNAARTYIAKSNNRLYELPLTWFSQGSKWAMSPGYERKNVRFDRLLSDRCIACHNSYPVRVPHVTGKYMDIPEGIGCERCHGPGALHVDERLEELTPPDSIDTSIVNPKYLSPARQLDVCRQCHVTGAVTVYQEGRNAFQYRPGEPMTSHVAVFEEHTRSSQNVISVVSHADRMILSACFEQTLELDNPMTCVTCHDPHNGFRAQGPEYFNNTCLTCHSDITVRFSTEPAISNHTGEVNCFSCHMPRVDATNAPHASFTDHWIRVVSADDLTTASDHVSSQLLTPLLSGHQDPNTIRLGMAHLILGEQKTGSVFVNRGMSILDTALSADPDHGDAQFLYGRALLRDGQLDAAIAALERANELDGDIPERMQELAWAYEVADRSPALSEQLYREALDIQPENAEIRVRLADLLEAEGQLHDALTEFSQAIIEQPWLESAHYGHGTTALKMELLDEAETSFASVLDLNPDFTNALINLGAIKILKQDLEGAILLFERAVFIEPVNEAALGNLGLVYAQLGRYSEARDRLQQLLIISPQNQRAREALKEVRRLLQ